jgi:predicted GNAT family acetyltransferase
MDVVSFDDPRAFLEAAEPLLMRDEARHNLILGLAGTLRDHPGRYPEFRLWVVTERDNPVGAALRTPPHYLVLARARDASAAAAIAAGIDDELPGVVGSLPEVDQFAAAWVARTGGEARRVRDQGLFALEQVEPARAVAGSLRDATEADRPLIRDWYRAFAMEAIGDENPDEERLQQTISHRLEAENAGLVLWEDGEPVSLAGFGDPTPNGIRIGPVYTPPELRGRGYASALVAELSSRLLESGRRFCFLYTDLANPTANRIYERIGYRRVCESAEIEFVSG